VVREVTWTSPKPFAKGTTRTLRLAGGSTLNEVFWAWEPNRRMGFSVTAASIAWLSGLSEVYEIAPLSSERCKLRWVGAASFPGMLGKTEPVIGPIFRSTSGDCSRSLSVSPASARRPLERGRHTQPNAQCTRPGVGSK